MKKECQRCDLQRQRINWCLKFKMFSRDHTWEGNEHKGCLLWVEKEANLTWGSGPGVSLLEPCSGNAHLGCPLQEQHSWGSAPLSGLFPSMSFPGKDAEEASREGNSTARQDTQSGSNWRLSASCTPELISGPNRAAFLLKTRSGKGVFLVRVYFIRFRPALCTKGLAKSQIKQREGGKKGKESCLQKARNGRTSFSHRGYTSDWETVVVFSNQPKLGFQISSPNCGSTVACICRAEKVVFTDKRESSNIRPPRFPLLQIWGMRLICIFSIHLHSVFNSP